MVVCFYYLVSIGCSDLSMNDHLRWPLRWNSRVCDVCALKGRFLGLQDTYRIIINYLGIC